MAFGITYATIALTRILLLAMIVTANMTFHTVPTPTAASSTTSASLQNDTISPALVFDSLYEATEDLINSATAETATELDPGENNFILYCFGDQEILTCPRFYFTAEGHCEKIIDNLALKAGDFFWASSTTECQIFEGEDYTDIKHTCPRFTGRVTIRAKDSQWRSHKCWNKE